ncbi:hypothetical protein UZ73_13305 [Alcaligenes faecalis]|nr:hypothetical protein UZ73_13305 [Alcaligenes faecalis]
MDKARCLVALKQTVRVWLMPMQDTQAGSRYFLIVKGARSWALTLNLKDAAPRSAQRFMPA